MSPLESKKYSVPLVLQSELAAAKASVEQNVAETILRCAKQCKDEAAHIKENAIALSKFVDSEHEARCRELCSTYLTEFAEHLRNLSPSAIAEQVARMKEDAENYRWLRDIAPHKRGVPAIFECKDLEPTSLLNGDYCDTAIKAAREGGT